MTDGENLCEMIGFNNDRPGERVGILLWDHNELSLQPCSESARGSPATRKCILESDACRIWTARTRAKPNTQATTCLSFHACFWILARSGRGGVREEMVAWTEGDSRRSCRALYRESTRVGDSRWEPSLVPTSRLQNCPCS